MRSRTQIAVVDLFAGPGGLGEGFSAYADSRGGQPFKIALSIEKGPVAHQTLTLRGFFRQFPPRQAPAATFERCASLGREIGKRHLSGPPGVRYSIASNQRDADDLLSG